MLHGPTILYVEMKIYISIVADELLKNVIGLGLSTFDNGDWYVSWIQSSNIVDMASLSIVNP